MKKTLLGVLAFVLVLATVLTGTVLAKAADENGNTLKVGTVSKVAADTPIKVDGRMDVAYATATPALVEFYANDKAGVYTNAIARFAWSEQEKALYCYVIVNDDETNPEGANPWESDSVELFIDWGNSGEQAWGLPDAQVGGSGAIQRGLQYRISAQGAATCYLLEEGGGTNTGDTYKWDPDLGRFTNKYNYLINATTNIFGWTTDTTDTTGLNTGYAARYTDCGYAVEFKLKNDNLTAGYQFGFDIQLNDRFNGGMKQSNVYYNGKYRVDAKNWQTGNNTAYYDYYELSDTEIKNDTTISDTALADYGMAQATSKTTSAVTTPRTTTKKVTIDRIFTTRIVTTKAPVTTSNNGGAQGGDNTQGGGGCGSSIAIGSSISMIALVGVAGFFSFRKKKDDDQ